MKRQIEYANAAPTRRYLLGGLVATAGFAWVGPAMAQSCYVAAKLASGDRGMRLALNYKVVSSNPKQRCETCAFFAAATQAGCGKCKMLSDGPVDAASTCDSWTSKG